MASWGGSLLIRIFRFLRRYAVDWFFIRIRPVVYMVWYYLLYYYCQHLIAYCLVIWSRISDISNRDWKYRIGELFCEVMTGKGAPLSVHSWGTAKDPRQEPWRISVSTPETRRFLRIGNCCSLSGWKGWVIFANPNWLLLQSAFTFGRRYAKWTKLTWLSPLRN